LSDIKENFLDYPIGITEFDWERNFETCLDWAVFDIEQGLMLKLGEDCKVLHAMNGWKKLNGQ
jgi:hypothetical protein